LLFIRIVQFIQKSSPRVTGRSRNDYIYEKSHHKRFANLSFPSSDITECGTTAHNEVSYGYSRFNRSGILNLSGMDLQCIPNDVFAITNLKGLSLDKNPMPCLSTELIQTTLLELLSLRFFWRLQDFKIFNERWPVARWPLLSTLRLRGICLEKFDLCGIFRITSLTALSLSKNSISNLPQESSNLVNLMKPDLSHNSISFVPGWFSSLCNLNEVDSQKQHHNLASSGIWFKHNIEEIVSRRQSTFDRPPPNHLRKTLDILESM